MCNETAESACSNTGELFSVQLDHLLVMMLGKNCKSLSKKYFGSHHFFLREISALLWNEQDLLAQVLFMVVWSQT